MKDSLFRASIRALLVAFFAVAGILLACFAFALFFSTIDSSDEAIKSNYDAEILPNAKGVRKKMDKSAPVILELEIEGVIGGPELTDAIVKDILIESRENSLKDDRVKAILLRINSPGGTITDADGIYRAIKTYKEQYKLPVFAYVDGLCASGGYYVACASDRIFSSKVSIIGSIGVITTPFMNVTKLMEKVGVDSLTVYAGKGKDDLNPFKPWKPDEDKSIRDLIVYYYDDFVNLVVENRPKLTREALVTEYGAKVFAAEEALKIGMIDENNANRSMALTRLLEKLGIEDDYYQVVRMTSSNWLAKLFSKESPIITGQFKHEFKLEGREVEQFKNQPLFLFKP